MSYCRFGWEGSDVYVFGNGLELECCACVLVRREWKDVPGALLGGYLEALPGQDHVQTRFSGPDASERMIDHLLEHRSAGHTVPEHALERLRDPEDKRRVQEMMLEYRRKKENEV